jgi:hypothetical protein
MLDAFVAELLIPGLKAGATNRRLVNQAYLRSRMKDSVAGISRIDPALIGSPALEGRVTSPYALEQTLQDFPTPAAK